MFDSFLPMNLNLQEKRKIVFMHGQRLSKFRYLTFVISDKWTRSLVITFNVSQQYKINDVNEIFLIFKLQQIIQSTHLSIF